MCWSVTRGLESNLTSWPIQGWRPPDADTAIRPLRVDGWPAPTATLFILLKRSSASGLRVFTPKRENTPVPNSNAGPGFLSLVQGSSREIVSLGLEREAPVSLSSLRAAWVQIPLPAPT